MEVSERKQLMAGEEINREEAIVLILLISAFLCPDLKKTVGQSGPRKLIPKHYFWKVKLGRYSEVSLMHRGRFITHLFYQLLLYKTSFSSKSFICLSRATVASPQTRTQYWELIGYRSIFKLRARAKAKARNKFVQK